MNYYNENDPNAAAWLRELIRAGLIANGIVDERSITEVKHDELKEFVQCHFFAGIGGWSYALRLAGWPDDVPAWTGSCPCQPLSCAGLKKGHADERHLWPAFYDLIAERRPATVFGEQVASADGREWLAGIRADLEGMGYAVGSADLCAAGVGAPHKRQRIYWVANAHGYEHRGIGGGSHGAGQETRIRPGTFAADGGADDGLADAKHAERRPINEHREDGCDRADGRREETHGEPGTCGEVRHERLADTRSRGSASGFPESEQRQERDAEIADNRGGGTTAGMANAADGRQRLQRDGESGRRESRGGFSVGDASSGGCGERGDASQPGSGGHVIRAGWSRYDLLPCRDGKARRVESGTFPLAHGFPGRVGLLRGYGNAIVPQLAAEFIAAAHEAFLNLNTANH